MPFCACIASRSMPAVSTVRSALLLPVSNVACKCLLALWIDCPLHVREDLPLQPPSAIAPIAGDAPALPAVSPLCRS